MYQPMTQEEIDAWDEREEMLARGLIKPFSSREWDTPRYNLLYKELRR